MRLQGKVAIVTGGAGGIGRAITRVFSREGAKVLFVDISDENGFALEKEIAEAGGEGKFLNVDISQKDSAEAIRDAAVAAFGRIDILVNNAHASRQAPLLEQTQEMFDLSFGTGFYPTVHLMQACYPQLKESIKALFLATDDPLENYREGVRDRGAASRDAPPVAARGRADRRHRRAAAGSRACTRA